MLNVKVIKARMKYRGLNQTELARRMGMHKQYLSMILKYHKSCSITTLAKFRKALGLTLDELWK